MTTYRERHLAGVHSSEGTPNAAAAAPVEDDNGSDDPRTLAELKAEAQALGLPDYGTKADLRARIANAGS